MGALNKNLFVVKANPPGPTEDMTDQLIRGGLALNLLLQNFSVAKDAIWKRMRRIGQTLLIKINQCLS